MVTSRAPFYGPIGSEVIHVMVMSRVCGLWHVDFGDVFWHVDFGIWHYGLCMWHVDFGMRIHKSLGKEVSRGHAAAIPRVRLRHPLCVFDVQPQDSLRLSMAPARGVWDEDS